MDGVIRRNFVKSKRRFPWGDLIVWTGLILLFSGALNFPPFLSRFLYGVLGIFCFAVLTIIILLGVAVKLENRICIDKQYLLGSIFLIFSFFTAVHLGFTVNRIEIDSGGNLGEYLGYGFSKITPGGAVFALPSFLLFAISGQAGAFIILGVTFVIGATIALNRAVVKKGENKVLKFITADGMGLAHEDKGKNFNDEAIKMYDKLDSKYKELLEEESRKKLEDEKSLLGLTLPPRSGKNTVSTAEPVPLSALRSDITPEEINAASLKSAGEFVGGLTMYNNGEKIPWQSAEAAAQAWQTFSPAPSPPTGEQAPINQWQWQGPQIKPWTPPAPQKDAEPPNLPFRGTARRNNLLRGLENQTAMPFDEQIGAKPKSAKYIRPTLDLVHTESMDLTQFNEEAKEKQIALDELFIQYKVGARVDNFTVAPAVTRFEIVPEVGTSVKHVSSLSDDINFALRTNNTRMESPIEGKNAIGIEVPNRTVGTVSIKDLLGCREFINHPSPLAICIGKSISNEPVIADLVGMPHLLVAGTTGSGKSVCINSILTSLIYKTAPDDLKLLLIDMKGGVELGMYNNLPHMLVPHCITDAARAINALKWLNIEMRRRYDLLNAQSVTKISLYHALPDYKNGRLEQMPYIVMIIDETADLMAGSRKEVEENIQSLASLARAAGIHIILATQRPSVNVISGVIKANIGTRIAFRVLNGVDSRTILDCQGAETLVGRGDMLFMTAEGIQRVQGCYLDNVESRSIVSFVRDKNDADFDIELEDIILNGMPDGGAAAAFGDGNSVQRDQDPLFVQVLKYAVREGNAKHTLSISEIQRIFSIGFGRAGKIVDQLEKAGYIGPDTGNARGREVIITRDQAADIYGA
jgi:DNA segregation ATPase FtsK/SpoIIIE-like protein